MRRRWVPISRLSSPWSPLDDWTNSNHATLLADFAVQRRLFSPGRTLSRGAAWSQVRAMPRQSDRRWLAHGIWRRIRSDGVGGATLGYGHGQLDRPAGAVSAGRRRLAIRWHSDAGTPYQDGAGVRS